jgi:hypothetical protein
LASCQEKQDPNMFMKWSLPQWSAQVVKGVVSLLSWRIFPRVLFCFVETLSKAKADRLNLMSETFAISARLLSYMDEDGSAYNSMISVRQDSRYADNRPGWNVHKMWCVSDEAVIAK